MQAMDHEHIVKLYDIKQTVKNYYLIMEYCSGGDLDRLRGKQLSECTVQRIVHQISSALKALIEKNIMHRDLKLSNLLLSKKGAGGMVKLADFGLARQFRDEEYSKTYCGTPLYMAPEILSGKQYDLKADLWSVGVLIYVFLTGKFPFTGSSPNKLLVELNHGIAKFPTGIVISDNCFALLKNLLQIDPNKRLDWKEYFEHPFINTKPEEYVEKYESMSKHNAPGFINASNFYVIKIEIKEEVKAKVEPSKSDDLEVIFNVLEDAVSKAGLILATFNVEERFSEIDTYQKEAFDLLWKTCKIIKPLVAAFIPPEEAFLFDSSSVLGDSTKTFLVTRLGTKEKSIELTEALVRNLRRTDKYKELARKLLEKYETIISNLVGYADVLSFIKNYNSKVSLFKYSLSLAHEGNILESSSKDNRKIVLKYSQAMLVLSLILRDYYGMMKGKAGEVLEYEVMNEKGVRVGDSDELDEDIAKILKIKLEEDAEAEYIRKIREELQSKCFPIMKAAEK